LKSGSIAPASRPSSRAAPAACCDKGFRHDSGYHFIAQSRSYGGGYGLSDHFLGNGFIGCFFAEIVRRALGSHDRLFEGSLAENGESLHCGTPIVGSARIWRAF
jgi:hypothetical protein